MDFEGNIWYCFDCNTKLGPNRVYKCPHCGSEEVDNIG